MTIGPWSTRAKLAVALAGLVLVVLAWQGWALHRARANAGELGLVADTLRASRDSSRRVAGRLGDSLGAVTRLVVQLRQESDALDRVLGETRTANAQLVVRVARLTAAGVRSTEPVRADSAGVRSASWRLRQAPFTIAASAELPPPPATGTLSVDVALDSAVVGFRLGCSTSRGPGGVRSAIATATGPAWLALSVGRVEQSPDVCNPPPATVARLAWWRRCAPTILLGYGAVLASDGRAVAGLAMAGGVDVLRCFR